MHKYYLVLLITAALIPLKMVNAAQGRLVGEHEFPLPAWFKMSFLDIQEDAREAMQANKHIMLFMHIDRCPYCTRMLEENFQRGKNKAFIQKHFEVIALNIRGDREIAWDSDTTYSEKSLAKTLNVMATPAIVFLNATGQKVYQMNGYRKPSAFKHVLNYIKDKQYKQVSLIDYLAQQQKAIYTFKSHPQFINVTDLSAIKGPMAVLFEDKNCADCNEFYQEVLHHSDVRHELKAFKVIRLDALATTPMIDNLGRKTTVKDWVRTLKMDYRPGTILFDQGKEITRLEGRLYHFHYKELLRYVSGGFYKQYPTYIDYLGPRQKALLQAGINIDVSR